MLTRTLYQI